MNIRKVKKKLTKARNFELNVNKRELLELSCKSRANHGNWHWFNEDDIPIVTESFKLSYPFIQPKIHKI